MTPFAKPTTKNPRPRNQPALEIQAFMNQMKEIKSKQGLPYWELRLGIHSGALVAGVIGEKKFTYDVSRDTVNTASRCGIPPCTQTITAGLVSCGQSQAQKNTT